MINIEDIPDLLETETFVDYIVDKMNVLDEKRVAFEQASTAKEDIHVDPNFVKNVLGNITAVTFSGEVLEVHYGRGIELSLEFTKQPTDNVETLHRKILRVLRDIVLSGQVRLRTSPFIVKYNISTSSMATKYIPTFDQCFKNGPNVDLIESVVKNPHDDGLNCWGGWSGAVGHAFKNSNLVGALVLIDQRMRQINLDDGVGSGTRINKIFKMSLPDSGYFKINPYVIIDSLIANDIITEAISSSTFFISDENHKLKICDGVLIDVDYPSFIAVLENIRDRRN